MGLFPRLARASLLASRFVFLTVMCKPGVLTHHLHMSPGTRVLLAVSLAGCAGQHHVAPTPPANAPSDVLVARARGGDTLIDFTALRRKYSHMTVPAGAQWDSLVAHGAIDSAVVLYYGSVRAHEIAASLLTKRGDRRGAEAEEALVRGFVRSIAVGSGLSVETAFDVYSIPEEYAVMRARHLRVTMQALLEHGAYAYDALTGVDSAGRSVTYYFRLLNGL
jgi:hypothetical protein